jgi:hypothetical protein
MNYTNISFNADHEIHQHQFVGLVSSYTRFNVLTSFHLHSFITFYTDSDSNTVVTCSLTTIHHILFNMQDCLLQLLQLLQFWKTESFFLSLTNTVIGSDVKSNQDSIHGYMGLGFDMSNFKEDSSDDVYTIGISMPICMVQFGDSFTWSKYSHRIFPNDLSKMMILEMNNVDELFHQNLTEFLQSDIDGSVDFSLNAITIQSLEKYLKTFYTPPLDIDQISSIWDQIICNPKTIVTVAEEVWECARKVTIIPFQSSRQCFISVFWNIDFLNQLWSCYSSFIFKLNLLHLITMYFLGIN